MVAKISVYKVLFFCVAVLLFVNSVVAYDLSDYYPLEENNRWEYSVLENEERYDKAVIVKGKEVISNVETVKMVSDDTYSCFVLDAEGVKKYKGSDRNDYIVFEPPEIIFPVNMEVGEIKEYPVNSIDYDIYGKKMGEVPWINKVSFSAIEDVEVPAGKFNNCLKFSLLMEWEEAEGSYGIDDTTIWLAPGIGKVKEYCFSTEYDAKEEENFTSSYLMELVSADINGKRIGD